MFFPVFFPRFSLFLSVFFFSLFQLFELIIDIKGIILTLTFFAKIIHLHGVTWLALPVCLICLQFTFLIRNDHNDGNNKNFPFSLKSLKFCSQSNLYL